MPPAELTLEQQQAIATRDVSVALSAGAGCGKTYVLTERFLSHLGHAPTDADVAESADLRQLIAITFTDAAAREMRSRIRDKCYERLQSASTESEQAHWLRLLREIDAARVSTIHAFCASLLRANAAEAGLDPTFGVLDQGDADVLQYNVIDDVLREKLTQLDAATLDLAAAFGLSRLKQQIAVLLRERNREYFTTWIDATPEQVVDRWRDWYRERAIPDAVREIAAEACVDEITALIKDITPTKPAFQAARQELLQLLPKLKAGTITAVELESLCGSARIKSREGPYICTAKDWPDKQAYERYSELCAALRECIDKHQPPPWDEVAARKAAELGLDLLRLSAKVVGEYNARKDSLGQLDFDDLLAKAYALITDPHNADLRERLAGDLRLLLVDEFQDTDELQVALVKSLCGQGVDTGRLFFVGDFKQSIYRFRGAVPGVFLDLQNELAERSRLPLNENFRSQPAVLHFVNALFCEAFGQAGEGFQPLRASRPQMADPPAVEFLWTITPDKNSHTKGATDDARRQEARAIARRIRSLVDPHCKQQPIVDKQTGQPRVAKPGDIAILFRALSDVQVYEEALREYGLDYYLVGGHAFYAQQEIYDVLNLLRAVASTADELSLAGALRSPIFALADETLFWLVDSAGSLNAGLMAEHLPAELSDEEKAKTAAAADTIGTLRNMKDRLPIAMLLGKALERTGYDAVLLAEFLGERKLANLQKLMERARAADRGVTDLDGFITQLAQFIAEEPKEALAATLPEAADVIRLMTIHHAKGLEFPLVIVPDLDRQANLSTPCAALHRDLGPLVPPPNDDEKKAATGMAFYAAMERVEELEERKRLLYVAVTRAADCLILASSLEAFDKPKSDWMKLLAERFNLQSGALACELPPDYETPSVRVVSEPHTDRKPVGRSRGVDLLKMLEEAHKLAAEDGGIIPPEVAPVPVDLAARRQFSFSRLSGQIVSAGAPRVFAAATDAASSPEATDGRGLGSLVHDVLARLDFRNPTDVGEWCEHLAPAHVLVNAESAARLACEMIQRFAGSSRARQLVQAAALHPEVEFLLAWPPQGTNGDTRYFRGYIDCLYQDSSGGWHLVDYKTNDIAASDVPRVAEGYELQMVVYAMAAERALGQPPVELALHFLRPGVEHIFPWNDASRQRAKELINAAILSATDGSLQRPVQPLIEHA